MRLIDDGVAVLARSPAKLNLLLAIRGRRSDGFHEIETLMVKISLFDTLRFTRRDDDSIVLRTTRSAPGISEIPVGRENLVVRAAELLREKARTRHGANIYLEKRIPSEAGLAGGSGNAAAALSGLARLWRLDVSGPDLAGLAGRLGSDIPFFLSHANAAVARGRGELIEPTTIRRTLHFVVLKPEFGLPTAKVYQAFTKQMSFSRSQTTPLLAELTSRRVAGLTGSLRNDLIPAAENLRPELVALRNRLSRECRYGSLMTGSGSACFGICGSAREASVVAARLRAARLGRLFTAALA